MNAVALLAGGSAACAALAAFDVGLALVARTRGEAGRSFLGPRLRSVLLELGPRTLNGSLIRRIAPPGDLRARIVAAGEPGAMGVREWTAIKAGCAIASLLIALPVAGAAPGRLGLLIALCASPAGFFVPDFWLARAARARIEQAIAQLPDMLDLMRVAVESGSAPVRAMAGVAARFDGALAAEWRRVAGAVVLGCSVDEAFGELAERLPDPQLRRFVEMMRGASRHGLGLTEALGGLASGARHAAHQQVREHAAKAGPKIQLVVALILVPSVMLVVAAAMVSQIAGVQSG